MNLEEDKDLLYIAREGLKAPLPEPWKACRTKENEIYYFNFATGDSTWEHPLDEFYMKKYQEMKAKKNQQQQVNENQGTNAGAQAPVKLEEEAERKKEQVQTNKVEQPAAPSSQKKNFFEEEFSEILEEVKGDDDIIEEELVFAEQNESLNRVQHPVQSEDEYMANQSSTFQDYQKRLDESLNRQFDFGAKPENAAEEETKNLNEELKAHQERQQKHLEEYARNKQRELEEEKERVNQNYEEDLQQVKRQIDDEFECDEEKEFMEEEQEKLKSQIQKECAESLEKKKQELIEKFENELTQEPTPKSAPQQDPTMTKMELEKQIEVNLYAH